MLAFAFGLSAEIERNLISERTKEALSRKKAEGKKLGRPFGSKNLNNKLYGKENEIQEMLRSRTPISTIAKHFKVHRQSLYNHIQYMKLVSG